MMFLRSSLVFIWCSASDGLEAPAECTGVGQAAGFVYHQAHGPANKRRGGPDAFCSVMLVVDVVFVEPELGGTCIARQM